MKRLSIKYFIIFISVVVLASQMNKTAVAKPNNKDSADTPIKPLTASIYGQLTQNSLFAISPSGNRIAYRNTKGEQNTITLIDLSLSAIIGEVDTVVPKEQSEMMHKALLKAGKQSELIILKDGNHHLSKEKNRIKALEAIETFLISSF